ncbi:Histone-lysine N-methyltransferase [Nymphaea thermarum]|nr:Histone-lysine N-methyltransferase [Nymphaea thermarum]
MTPSIRLICPWEAHHRKRTEAPRHLLLRGPSPDLPTQKYRSMSEIIANTAPGVALTCAPYDDSDDDDTDDYSGVKCEECRSGECGGEMLLCDKCDRGFHIFCLRPIIVRVPTGPWFCPSCSSQKTSRVLRLSQTKIIDFFRIQKPDNPVENFSIDARKRRRRSGQLVISKKKRRLLPFVPSVEPERRLEQMRSLAVGLKALKMQFYDDLTYVPGMAPRSANAAKLEKGGMQVLSKEDTQTLEQCKAMYKRGEGPPLLVTFDPFEG